MELGLLYGLVALALYISFGLLKIADLSTDGCFTLGCAVGASMTVAGHPFLALPAAMAAGILSGYVTAFLQTKLGVESILAGIIVNTGLYTINFLAMGSSSNLNIFGSDTIFSLAKGVSSAGWYESSSRFLSFCVSSLSSASSCTGSSTQLSGFPSGRPVTMKTWSALRLSTLRSRSRSASAFPLPDSLVRCPSCAVSEVLRHQLRDRAGHHCAGFPDDR